MAKDYYKTLGIDKSATKDEIKKAFHKMAHKHHPDKNGGDDALFKEINEAYQVLSDDNKRAQYDRFGSADGNYGNPYGQGGFGGFDFNGSQGFEFNMGDLGDIFGDFFGGNMRGGNNKPQKGRDILTEIDLQMSELIMGVDKTIRIKKVSVCDSCDGIGTPKGEKLEKCSECNGSGQIRRVRKTILGSIQEIAYCDKCDGEGEIIKTKCKTCHGSGGALKEVEYKIHIPSGSNNGETLRLSKAGEFLRNKIPGDLYVKLNLKFPKKLSEKQKKLLEEMQKEGL